MWGVSLVPSRTRSRARRNTWDFRAARGWFPGMMTPAASTCSGLALQQLPTRPAGAAPRGVGRAGPLVHGLQQLENSIFCDSVTSYHPYVGVTERLGEVWVFPTLVWK